MFYGLLRDKGVKVKAKKATGKDGCWDKAESKRVMDGQTFKKASKAYNKGKAPKKAAVKKSAVKA